MNSTATSNNVVQQQQHQNQQIQNLSASKANLNPATNIAETKEIESALSRVEARNDLSLLYPPMLLSNNSQKRVNALSAGVQNAEETDLFTVEVRKIVLEECNVIFECKNCKNLFRSLANLVKHKRSYCLENAVERNAGYSDSICRMIYPQLDQNANSTGGSSMTATATTNIRSGASSGERVGASSNDVVMEDTPEHATQNECNVTTANNTPASLVSNHNETREQSSTNNKCMSDPLNDAFDVDNDADIDADSDGDADADAETNVARDVDADADADVDADAADVDADADVDEDEGDTAGQQDGLVDGDGYDADGDADIGDVECDDGEDDGDAEIDQDGDLDNEGDAEINDVEGDCDAEIADADNADYADSHNDNGDIDTDDVVQPDDDPDIDCEPQHDEDEEQSPRQQSSVHNPEMTPSGSNSGSSTGGGGIMKLKIQLKTRPDEKSKVYEIAR